MQMNNIEHIGFHIAQRQIDTCNYAIVVPVAMSRHAITHLGREHVFAAAMCNMPPDALFRESVTTRRINQRDAQIQRGV